MNNIFVLDKNYNKIGTLSNQGVKPLAPYFNDLFVQELETGADTYEFSTISNSYTQGCIEIGNHIMFAYKNRNELFTITSIEYSHNEGYKTVGVYAEGLNFKLLDIYMEKPKVSNSGSSGGTDNDNDGDDNYDDEYADVDDIYIDENGNIIYDKDGSGLGDVTVDGDGNIIYKRSKRKDGTGDSLEFNNISYPTFIKMMLKNTGWSYVCQPGLESNKQDMRVSYDKNIYAILQDSMQTYKGVELEFRYEYNNGKVTKTVYAYNDGGRGSFVGKRFEYGTNVKGITKMQEVTHEKEDAILFVDNIGVEVTYDVDFALKSAEITDIEIGDTHYVIDSDFHPPMNIKARIGKIEISFSDPTRNKMYLANNKKIRGAVEEIEDIIDERIDNGGDVPDHDHNCLKDYSEPSYVYLRHEMLPDNYTCPFYDYEYTHKMCLEPEPHGDTYSAIGDTYSPWNFIHGYLVDCKRLVASDATSVISKNIENSIYVDSLGVRSTRYMVKMPNNRIENATTMSTKDLYNFIKNLTICKYTNKEETALLDDGNSYTFGISNADEYANSGDAVAGGLFRKLFDISNDNTVRVGSGFIENSLLCALIGAFQYYATGNDPGSGGDNPGTGTITGTFDVVSGNEIFVGKIDAIAIEAAQVEVTNSLYAKDIVAASISKMDSAEIDLIKTGTIDVGVRAKIKEIEFPDGSTLTTANGSGGTGGCIFEKVTTNEGNTFYYTDNDIQIERDLYVNGTLHINSGDGTGMGIVDCDILEVTEIKFPDGTILTSANGSGAGGTTPGGGGSSGSSPSYDSENDKITVSNAQIGPTYNPSIDNPNNYRIPINPAFTVNGDMLLIGRLYIIGTWYCNGNEYSDKSLKENIRYIDNTGAIIVDKENLETRDYSKEELLEKTDLYDFIVNQVNICEYNFIDDNDNRKKIGFIANEYEGTKVGDKIVNRDKETDLLGYDPNNLLFATIGALQEEVRTRDEQIASLEARLARLEALLGIDN